MHGTSGAQWCLEHGQIACTLRLHMRFDQSLAALILKGAFGVLQICIIDASSIQLYKVVDCADHQCDTHKSSLVSISWSKCLSIDSLH